MKALLVHDYLTQRGGAERVVLAMTRAFPDAPLYTSLYDPAGTFPEFRDVDVRTLSIDRARLFRRRHRLALPLLALAFSRLRLQADVVLCSSSGWAHGARVDGRKVVYCHAPARWLYQPERYFGVRWSIGRVALSALRPALLRWDRVAASSADRYLANSNAVRDAIRATYGIEAEVLPPPAALDAAGPRRRVSGIEPGFLLCVSRLLPYKNVAAVVEAVAGLRDARLAVVGDGPEKARLQGKARSSVALLGSVADDELRWLYSSCTGVVAASYEDYGLTPLEAAAFGKPAAVLRFGGFLDTVREGETGVFFNQPTPAEIRKALEGLLQKNWNEEALREHAERFSEDRFVDRLRTVVNEEAERAGLS